MLLSRLISNGFLWPIHTALKNTILLPFCVQNQHLMYHRWNKPLFRRVLLNTKPKRISTSRCPSIEHANYFGADDKMGAVAVSIRREKLEDTKDLKDQYQYRLIVRTSEVWTIRRVWVTGMSQCENARSCYFYLTFLFLPVTLLALYALFDFPLHHSPPSLLSLPLCLWNIPPAQSPQKPNQTLAAEANVCSQRKHTPDHFSTLMAQILVMH